MASFSSTGYTSATVYGLRTASLQKRKASQGGNEPKLGSSSARSLVSAAKLVATVSALCTRTTYVHPFSMLNLNLTPHPTLDYGMHCDCVQTVYWMASSWLAGGQQCRECALFGGLENNDFSIAHPVTKGQGASSSLPPKQ